MALVLPTVSNMGNLLLEQAITPGSLIFFGVREIV
jgi:hypothetical protein